MILHASGCRHAGFPVRRAADPAGRPRRMQPVPPVTRPAAGTRIALNGRPAHTRGVTTAPWTNWGRCAAASPAYVEHPGSVDALARTVRAAAERGSTVKPVGAGHSFTPIAATDGALIELDRLTGIESVEPTDSGAHVTVYAGT